MCHANQEVAKAPKTPKSPWRRLLRQPTRPRLARSVVPSAKINLNRYWNKFEEMTSLRPRQELILVAPRRMTNSNDDNEVNENFINEQREIVKKKALSKGDP